MDIVKDFSGGNINFLDVNGDEIYVEREIRDDKGIFTGRSVLKMQAEKTYFQFPVVRKSGNVRCGGKL